MQSSNSKFDEYGWASMIRDVESLFLQLTDLGQEAEGQSTNLNTLQQSVAQTNTNVTALANRLTTDEAAITALQSSVAGISSYKTSNDICIISNSASVSCANTGASVAAAANTTSGGMASSYNTTSGLFTAPATGLYSLSASVQLTGAGAWSNLMAAFWYNETASANISLFSITGASFGILNVAGVVSLASGAQARLYVQTPNAGATTYQIFAGQITRL